MKAFFSLLSICLFVHFANANPTAAEVRKAVGADRGVVLILGKDAWPLASALVKSTQLTLLVQTADAAAVAKMQRQAADAGLLGSRVYVERGGGRIHLGRHLADGVIVGAGADAGDVARVARPGAAIYIGGKLSRAKAVAGLGDWSHPYHGPDNNPQATDTVAKGPYLTRFLATPYYGPMPEVTVTAGGRIFKAFGHVSYKEREWPMLNKLICLNAFNGTLLWERKLPAGYLVHRNAMVATADALYIADNDSCKVIDAATGQLRDEIVIGEKQGGPGWKWMALNDGVLYALVGKKDKLAQTIKGTRTQSGWPWSGMGKGYSDFGDQYAWGFGRMLVAIDVKTKKTLWTRTEPEDIDSRAMALREGKIFVYAHGKYLAAVNTVTGAEYWKTTDKKLLDAIGPHNRAQNPREGYASTVYTKAGGGVLLFAGPQRPRVVAVDAETGKLLWQHGDGNMQLILRPDGIYAMGRAKRNDGADADTSVILDYRTGRVLAKLDCSRGNCTRATGTADAIFARGYRHGGTMRLALKNKRVTRLPAMRPGCQDGVIAANGQLYWGPWMCDCNHSLVGIISLGPAGDFDFEQKAQEKERLEIDAKAMRDLAASEAKRHTIAYVGDWPTYRQNNRRTAATPVAVPAAVKVAWTFKPLQPHTPTAPVNARGMVYVAGSHGIIRAIDSTTGKPHWTAHTGGDIKYPPTLDGMRLYAGSADGWVYCFNANTGQRLWRFRAAPRETKIPVYGRLSSRWPVTSGVLVENGTAYAAAGIASHDGTHVYALDAKNGKLKWQNNTSGNLMGAGLVAGISVQGHLLSDGKTLYMAGGNVVSPAKYAMADGKCLNTLSNEWQKAPRGSELFYAAGEVRVVDRMMYSPRAYIPSRYYAKYLVQAGGGNTVFQGTEKALMCVSLEGDQPETKWQDLRFARTDAVISTPNALLVAGRAEGKPMLSALHPETGKPLWESPLPAPPAPWGVAVDRTGSIHVSLADGRVVCFAKK
ncbi:MAG: PQQ-binding-like beta-propeller repeat protein [Verrucomicrobiota bacterium]|nr:PQQ-binding-like beta-propeller repeat protein [Verrucomicrobiota bacterium]